jgi:hypothetical protein
MTTTIDPTINIEVWCLETARQIIRSMASENVFRALGTDRIDPVLEENVIARANSRPGENEETRNGERLNGTPGFICTFKGHSRPTEAGENCVDDGILRITVQLVDDLNQSDNENFQSYSQWMNDIRKRFQRKISSHISPFEECPLTVGQVYMVHVKQLSPPDETDIQFHEKMRSALMLECFTRTER